MARRTIGLALLTLTALGLAGAAQAQVVVGRQANGPAMPHFRSDGDLRRFLREATPPTPPPPPVSPPPPVMMAPPVPSPSLPMAVPGSAADAAAAVAPPAAMAEATQLAEDAVTVTAAASTSITNTQVAGVDEGGIVKVRGDTLVILRRGRLFTVSTAGGGLAPVDAVNAFPPGVDAGDDWYDEMLVSGDTVAVIGYSYGRGGTEINRFRLSADGHLSFRDSWHLRSDDYYSSRNFASRLIGDKLIIYSPLYLSLWEDDPLETMPGLDRWRPGQEQPNFRRFLTGRDVYIPAPLKDHPEAGVDMLHTVQTCDLSADDLACTATAVLGPEGHTFFVSRNAVYVWTAQRWGADDTPGWLIRMPLDGGAPSAVQVHGSPPDQFAFHPDADEGRMDVLTVSNGGGDSMWSPEFSGGRPSLLRLPMRRFGDGSDAAPASDYAMLPSMGDETQVDRDRYVGGHLLYAMSRWSDGEQFHKLVAVPVDHPEQALVMPFPEGVDRIEALGRDALVVGGDEDAAFVTVDLSGAVPAFADRYVQKQATEAESRSHAFFYRPDPGTNGDSGLLGLPITVSGRTHDGDVTWGGDSADMLFLRRADRRLSDFGRLEARVGAEAEDDCTASCTDWYGEARPIFLGNRVFALLGYELVEGDRSGAAIREIRRLDFTPKPAPPAEERP